MLVPTIDGQSLEKDHTSAGEHLKSSTKELQPLQPVSEPLCKRTYPEEKTRGVRDMRTPAGL